MGHFVGDSSALQLMTKRRIEHLLWMPLEPPGYLPEVPLKSLRFYRWLAGNVLLSLPLKYPLLEYLAFVDENVCTSPPPRI
jgi:hypothetical protein